MTRYLVGRVLAMAPILLIVTLIAFSLILFLPGDPAVAMLGENARPEDVQALRAELGLDQPVYIQYIQWLGKAVRGDFGRSLRTHQPVVNTVAERLPVTAQLVVIATLWALLIAIPVGLISAVRRNTLPDVLGSIFAMFAAAVPNFWTGVMLILLFGVILRWLPASGYMSPFTDLGQSLRLSLLPMITLGANTCAVVMRQMRASALDVIGEEYILTARAKGLAERTVVMGHLFKNALIPVLTVIALNVGRAFGGAVITETIFAIPGVGRLAVDSILARDFPVVQAVVLTMAVAVFMCNLCADVLYAYVDPRVRYG